MSAAQTTGIRIPVAPLEAAIDKAGGLGTLPSLGTRYVTVRDDGYEMVRYRRTDRQRREWERLRKLLQRQGRLGWIDLFQADAICCDHLRLHPMEVYGWDFLTYGETGE